MPTYVTTTPSHGSRHYVQTVPSHGSHRSSPYHSSGGYPVTYTTSSHSRHGPGHGHGQYYATVPSHRSHHSHRSSSRPPAAVYTQSEPRRYHHTSHTSHSGYYKQKLPLGERILRFFGLGHNNHGYPHHSSHHHHHHHSSPHHHRSSSRRDLGHSSRNGWGVLGFGRSQPRYYDRHGHEVDQHGRMIYRV